MAEIKANHNITEEKLKTRMYYGSSSDPKAMDSDKSCIICHKRKMSWPRYAYHLDYYHDLHMMEDSCLYLDLEEVIYGWEMWIKDLSVDPQSPDPRYYDSEKQCAISDFDSQLDDDSDNDESPKLLPLPERRRSSSTAESSS